jgi:hypothetical protein
MHIDDGGLKDVSSTDAAWDGATADEAHVQDGNITDANIADNAALDSNTSGVDASDVDAGGVDGGHHDDVGGTSTDATNTDGSTIEDLPPGFWLLLEGTEFNQSDAFIDRGGNSSIFAYSEGIFDPTRNRLAVWGGGHADSSDNGIYAFNLNVAGDSNDYRWIEVEPRSSNTHRSNCYQCLYDCSGGYLEDGAPIANHTQSFLEYHWGWDALISPLQGSVSTTGTCYTSAVHHNFNRYSFASNQWISDMADLQGLARSYFGTVVVDGFDNAWYFQTDSQPNYKVYQYKFSLDSWFVRADYSGAYGWEVFSAMDTDRNIAVVMGNGYFNVWDLSDETAPAILSSDFTGPDDVVQARAAGLAWDSASGLFVAWIGNETEEQDVYVLSVQPQNQFYHFMKVEPVDTDSTILPTQQVARGPLGRWAYSPQQNVFVLAYYFDQPVYLYKLSRARVDNDLPQVTLTLPSTSNDLQIPIHELSATDATSAIVGYQISTNAGAPTRWSTHWGARARTFTVPTSGTWQIYAWAMDAGGNISHAASASVEVNP